MNRLKEKYIKEVTPSLVENLITAQLCKHLKLIKSLSTWVWVMQYQMLKLRQSC